MKPDDGDEDLLEAIARVILIVVLIVGTGVAVMAYYQSWPSDPQKGLAVPAVRQ